MCGSATSPSTNPEHTLDPPTTTPPTSPALRKSRRSLAFASGSCLSLSLSVCPQVTTSFPPWVPSLSADPKARADHRAWSKPSWTGRETALASWPDQLVWTAHKQGVYDVTIFDGSAVKRSRCMINGLFTNDAKMQGLCYEDAGLIRHFG
jgi:hypothetical protein